MSQFAIIGISCLFPGANDPGQYWQLLSEGRDCRKDGSQRIFLDSPALAARGGSTEGAHGISCTRGGFIEGFSFDASGFLLDEDYLNGLDDVFRWPLHTAREALRDAGHSFPDPQGQLRTGLVLGNYAFPTRLSNALHLPLWYAAVQEGLERAGIHVGAALAERARPSRASSVPAEHARIAGLPGTVVAGALGLRGPRFTLDAACSSALYSLKLCCDILATGQADLMLAGAVCAADPLLIHLSFSDLRAYPKSGHSQPFDRNSQGIMTGQGSGFFAVKRAEDAIRDGNRIHALVDGIGLSNDGRGRHLLTPNPEGQLRALELAYADAGVDPNQCAYVECHATGTPIGDSTELDVLDEFFGRHAARPLIGSVKANLGHLLTVAGFSSMLKVILALRHAQIPPTLGVLEPIRSRSGRFGAESIVRESRAWPKEGTRRAAVSAFGFGGTNAHVVLSHPDVNSIKTLPSAPKMLDRLAIVGVGCHVGALENAPAVRDAVLCGSAAQAPPSSYRWRGMDQIPGLPETDEQDVKMGSPIDAFAFDPVAFRIPPAELQHFNQQHLLMLRVANEAVADAGFGGDARIRAPRRVAVVITLEMEPSIHGHRARFDMEGLLRGALSKDGQPLSDEIEARIRRIAQDSVHDQIQANEVLSYIASVVASRISSQWNFSGPSFTVASDRNAGGRALEVAGLLLLDPSIEAVLVGSVDLAAGPEYALLRRLTFEQGKDLGPKAGTDGAVALMLVRAREATNFARHYATLEAIHRSDALPQAGARSALAAPSSAELAGTLLATLHAAAASADQIGLVETSLTPGARDEHSHAAALKQVFPAAERPCVLSNATSTLGDTLNASLLTRVLSAALCLYEQHLPAMAAASGAENSAWAERLDGSRLALLSAAAPWLRESSDEPRRALVDSLSEAGNYTCLVLSRPPREIALESANFSCSTAPTFSAFAAPNLEALLVSLREFRQKGAGLEQQSGAFGPGGSVRAALLATDHASLLKEVDLALRDLPAVHARGGSWATPAGSYATSRPLGATARVAFVYPGGFSSYLGAGRDLFRFLPGLLGRFESQTQSPADSFRDGLLYARTRGAPSPRELIAREAVLSSDIPSMLAIGSSFATLYTDALRHVLGVKPDAAFGYSLGESSMLFALGVWPQQTRSDDKIRATPLFRDGLSGRKELLRKQWQIPDDVTDAKIWSGYVLLTSPERVQAAISRFPRVFLTHINTPEEVVVAGDPAQCDALIRELACPSARAPASLIMHCEPCLPHREELAELNRYPTVAMTDVELYSALHYERVVDFDSQAVADGISHTLVRAVDFRRLIERAYAAGCRYFIETGTGASCTRWIQHTLGDRAHLALAVDRRGQSCALGLLRVAAQLFCHGLPLREEFLRGTLDTSDPPERSSVRLRCGGEPIPTYIETRAKAVLRAADMAASARAPAASRAPEASYAPAASRAPEAPYAPPSPTASEDAGTFDAAPSDAGVGSGAQPSAVAAQDSAARLVASICEHTISAHGAVLEWQYQLQELTLLRAANSRRRTLSAEGAPALPDGAPSGRNPPRVLPTLSRDPPRTGSPQSDPVRKRPPGVIWDEADLLTFANGRVAEVFGPEFSPIDAFKTRVRLPSPPYLFVSRVTQLVATPRKLEPARITSEYDIADDAWFLLDGQVPPAVTIEAGQCDLMLIAYLGIDFLNAGRRVYRLLDSTLRFMGDLPRQGQTLRYEIEIKRFVRNADQLLFFFAYRCFADGAPILVLESACAGFFTQQELEASSGIVPSVEDEKERAAAQPSFFKPLCRTDKTALSEGDIVALTFGKTHEVFGAEFDQGGHNPSLRLPRSDLLMIDRVDLVDRRGGAWGLGRLVASKQLEPNAWYFSCHFSDDPVLAGSMVAEGAVQILQVFALYLGLQMCLPDACFQPIHGLRSQVKVRGQIDPSVRSIRYEVEVKRIDLVPRPQIVADVLVYRGDTAVIQVRDLGICLREKPGAAYRPEANGAVTHFLGRFNHSREPALLNEFHMAHAAKGDLGVAMGPEFDVYRSRRAPYIPNGSFLFVDRVMAIEGQRGKLVRGAQMVTEYDSPADAWYHRDAANGKLPNCILMETSLQAAILLGYYLGATLAHEETEFSIRNLDGTATLLRDLDLAGRTIRHRQTLLSTNAMAGSILQNFSYELSADGEVFYRGESLFGYFDEKALANQVGLDAGKHIAPWLRTASAPGQVLHTELSAHPWLFDTERSRLALSSGKLRLLDSLDSVADGGKAGLGYGLGYCKIDPTDWYFDCHFYRDPVMPGSLGVQAIIQALETFVLRHELHAGLGALEFTMPEGIPLRWRYRGQILKQDADMWVDFHVIERRKESSGFTLICDANLWKGDLRIYEVSKLALGVRTPSVHGVREAEGS